MVTPISGVYWFEVTAYCRTTRLTYMAAMSSISLPTTTAGRSSTAAQLTATVRKPTFITWTALAMMTTGSVASLRSAPTMAVFGLASVFLYLVPALVFLLPTSLVSAELASGWKGGVYNWVSEGLSAPMGLLAIWCQFALTIFYYPALLAYVGATLAYIIDPSLANNGVYTAAVIIVLFWGSVLASSRGVSFIAKLASNGTVIGTLIPGAVLVGMGIAYLAGGHPSAAPMNSAHLLPAWTGLAGVVLIVNNFLAYSGMEMNAVHVDELRSPATEFPKAIFLAMGLVLLIFILPALAISWVIPSQQISLTAGVMQAFSSFFAQFGVGWLVPLTAIALMAASLSGMIAWLAGPSKGLLLVGRQYGYLPRYFQQENAEGMQMHILVAQGVITTIIGLLYALIPSVSSAYWIFSVMTTQIYLIMYVLMFIAAVKLRRNQPDHPRGYRVRGLVTWCWIGGLASVAAFLIGFVPPSQFAHSSVVVYALLILLGIVAIGVLPPFLLYRFRKPEWKTADVDGHGATTPPAATTAPAPTAAPATPNGARATNGAAAADTNGSASAQSRQVSSPERHRAWTWGIVAALVILAIVFVPVFKQGKSTDLAKAKANRVEALYVAHDLAVPVDDATLVKVLGTNGGPVCASPAGALTKALKDQQFYNGAANVGARPIRASARIVQGEQFVLQVYCPEKLAAFNRYVNGNGYYPVVRR
jgi:glutamate:GABA antiporter